MTDRRANLLAMADRLVEAGNTTGCTMWLCQVTGPIRSLANEVRKLDKENAKLRAEVEQRGLFAGRQGMNDWDGFVYVEPVVVCEGYVASGGHRVDAEGRELEMWAPDPWVAAWMSIVAVMGVTTKM